MQFSEITARQREWSLGPVLSAQIADNCVRHVRGVMKGSSETGLAHWSLFIKFWIFEPQSESK
jgi:hypothetical protein